MIRLNVFIRVKEEKREAVLAAAKELVTASQKDKGCIAYDVFESATRHDVLMICVTILFSATTILSAVFQPIK